MIYLFWLRIRLSFFCVLIPFCIYDYVLILFFLKKLPFFTVHQFFFPFIQICQIYSSVSIAFPSIGQFSPYLSVPIMTKLGTCQYKCCLHIVLYQLLLVVLGCKTTNLRQGHPLPSLSSPHPPDHSSLLHRHWGPWVKIRDSCLSEIKMNTLHVSVRFRISTEKFQSCRYISAANTAIVFKGKQSLPSNYLFRFTLSYKKEMYISQ